MKFNEQVTWFSQESNKLFCLIDVLKIYHLNLMISFDRLWVHSSKDSGRQGCHHGVCPAGNSPVYDGAGKNWEAPLHLPGKDLDGDKTNSSLHLHREDTPVLQIPQK